ncbi:DUF2157 domain-containing protein [Oryzobacter telluris]|uniref:DUF2157 domain-containing protein n=1 Tax=Oryzobacter telluris TaxID=3149179 RepID=UPI00370D5B27
MTASPAAAPDAPTHRDPARHAASPAQLGWLDGELRAWHAEGLVDDTVAAAIRARYVEVRKVTLSRIVLTLGACFVGLGLIWLVASNLEAMAPLTRFVLMVVIWLGLVGVAEVLATRREREGDVASPVVGAVRLLAAGAFGAVVFQAAQSLQVPAYEPLLVGVWGLGAVLWAYAVRGVAPLVLGVGLLAFWFVWQVGDVADDAFSVSTALGAVGLASVGVGVANAVLGRREMAPPWREIGALIVLVGLFVAALPYAWGEPGTSWALWVGLAAAVVVAALAALRGDRLDRLEVGLAALALAMTVGLALWRFDTESLQPDDLGAGAWVRAFLAVAAYLVVASGYAVLGGMRDTGRLTWLATAALVVFVTTQAFAVFAPILSGATLFLVVGVVLLGTGVLADRGRRRLVREAKEAR